MQGKACAIVFVAALLAGCADAPSRQAETPAAREKAAAVVPTRGEDVLDRAKVEAPKAVAESKTRTARPAPRARHSHDDDAEVYVTLTTTWSDAPSKTAENGGSSALPVRRSGQREGVFAAPLAVSGLEDPTVF